MDSKPYTFCDWITVRQTHKPHEPFGAKNLYIDPDTGAENWTRKFIQVKGLHESSVLIRSDGEAVEYSGNPSRFDQINNVQGFTLDEAKIRINQLIKSLGLPEFTSKYQPSSEGRKYTGAKITRLDMTTNIKTGSPSKRAIYQKWLQTQEFPKLQKQLWGMNTYFGKESVSRTFRIYDKALQITDRNGDKPTAARLQQNGVIRYEWEYKQFLKTKGLEMWHRATQERLEKQFNRDIKAMTQIIKKIDFEEMPNHILATYLMYKEGVNLRERLNKNTFTAHKKALKAYGVDISNQTVVRLKQDPVIIEPEPYIDEDQIDLLEG